MRRSTILSLAMLLIVGIGLMLAAQSMLEPFREDAELANELTRLLQEERVLDAGERVRAFGRARPADDGLARINGPGLELHLVPSAAVRSRRGGVEALVRRAVDLVVERRRTRRTDWIEFRIGLGDADTPPFRTLVEIPPGGTPLPPAPPIPSASTPRPADPPPASIPDR